MTPVASDDPQARADTALVDQLEEVWVRIAELGADLSEDDWKTPTEVPGWSVQDNMTHITDVERMSDGHPPPDHVVASEPGHVKNDLGRRNEVFVDARRSWTGAEAHAEFVAVTTARIARLRTFTTADFDAASWTPIGPGTVRDLLPFRVFDSWIHEQDMRRAVGRPGGLEGPVANAAMDRIIGAAGFVVGKKLAPPDGTVVMIECTPPLARSVALVMDAGRARVLDPAPAQATVRIRTGGDIYARLSCGRVDPRTAVDEGWIEVDGDRALGRRLVEQLNFLF